MKTCKEIIKFCIVGGLAAMVHYCIAAGSIMLAIAPLLANFIGFVVAFQVSYYGHKNWTFQATSRHSLYKFCAIAATSFLINECIFYLLIQHTQFSQYLSLFIALAVVALLTFLLSRFWAFQPDLQPNYEK